jgi:hypothetical protein
MATHYVAGYGSLINPESRSRTGPSGEAIPIRVSGYQRAWTFVSPSDRMTVLGISPRQGSIINGVLVPITETGLPSFDAREEGYTRTHLAQTSITCLDGRKLLEGEFWIYVPKKKGRPTKACPIVQSYLDVVLTGCLDYGEPFAVEFIRSTGLCDYPRLNDRSAPRYVRGMRCVPLAEIIDRLLAENGVKPSRSDSQE